MFDEKDELEIENELNNSKNTEENVQINVTRKKKNFGDFKIKYKRNKKKYLVLTSAIFAMLSMTMGSSYAYLTYVSKTANSVVLNAGTLALTFQNEQNVISLTNAAPMSDKEGLAQTEEYSFDIKNNGTIPATYKITLDNTCETGVNIDLCIPDEYIKIGIKVGAADYKVVERNNNDEYIIETGKLIAGGSTTYKLKAWLAYNTPNTYNAIDNASIAYKGKLGLSYEQGEIGRFVYRWGYDNAINGTYLDAGTHTGYCIINGNNDSCTQGLGFASKTACEKYITNSNMTTGVTCEEGTWTSLAVAYTEDATTLNKSYYIRHRINSQTEILESYICNVMNDREYCIIGGNGVYDDVSNRIVSPSYNNNKQIANSEFGESKCRETDYSDYTLYYCNSNPTGSNITMRIRTTGYSNVSIGSYHCDVYNNGSSSCAMDD